MNQRQASPARILPADTVITPGAGGVLYARSPHPLGPYPRAITSRLDRWAADTPERVFLARRDDLGQWRTLTYAETHRRVRSIAQALIDRRLSPDRPIVILSGNSIEHALLALAAMYCGLPYAPLAPAYSLVARDHAALRTIWQSLTPSMVFAADGGAYGRALAAVLDGSAELVTCSPAESFPSTPFGALEATAPTGAVDDAQQRVGPETIAKILFTSGSTGKPKGVINTQRMLCANQQMLVTALPLLAEEPPVLCDWLPWNHTFGGNHNIGIVLYNGGTMYIDDGKPTPAEFAATIANLSEIATTAYFNVPRGYDLLVPRLRASAELRRLFFSRLKMLFCAAASLREEVAADLERMARDTCGVRLPFVTGLGATESAPFALCAGDAEFTGGRIGVPVPGVELKLAPVGDKLEGRLRGPNITPGYWRDEALTAAAFDDEAFYRLGDALGCFDPSDPSKGFTFQGRIAEDFKLSTGTWVRVGPLRAALLSHFGPIVQDAVIAGHDRDEVTAMIFPNPDACRELCGPESAPLTIEQLMATDRLRREFEERLSGFAERHAGSASRVMRIALLSEPPSLDAREVTDKGSINQRAVLTHRSAIVAQLYGASGTAPIIALPGEQA